MISSGRLRQQEVPVLLRLALGHVAQGQRPLIGGARLGEDLAAQCGGGGGVNAEQGIEKEGAESSASHSSCHRGRCAKSSPVARSSPLARKSRIRATASSCGRACRSEAHLGKRAAGFLSRRLAAQRPRLVPRDRRQAGSAERCRGIRSRAREEPTRVPCPTSTATVRTDPWQAGQTRAAGVLEKRMEGVRVPATRPEDSRRATGGTRRCRGKLRAWGWLFSRGKPGSAWQGGVHANRVTLSKWPDLTSSNPAQDSTLLHYANRVSHISRSS